MVVSSSLVVTIDGEVGSYVVAVFAVEVLGVPMNSFLIYFSNLFSITDRWHSKSMN